MLSEVQYVALGLAVLLTSTSAQLGLNEEVGGWVGLPVGHVTDHCTFGSDPDQCVSRAFLS